MEVLAERRFVARVRWTARTVGTGLLVLFAILAIGHIGRGGPNPLQGPLRENLLGSALVAMLIGQVVAWRREGIGSLFILGGLALFIIVNPGVRLNQSLVVVGAWLVTGLLHLVCWWRTPKTVGP